MEPWTLLYGDEVALGGNSELNIPILFDSPQLAYLAAANLSAAQIGTFVHWEFMGALGWSAIARYPAYKGLNILAITDGFNEQYRLSFLPAYSRSALISFSFKLWEPAMPLFTRSGGSAAAPSTAAAATAVTAATDTTTILAANTNRKGASIWNASTATLYLELGSTVSASDFAVAMGAGDYFEVPYNYTGVIVGLWTAANGTAMVREYT